MCYAKADYGKLDADGNPRTDSLEQTAVNVKQVTPECEQA